MSDALTQKDSASGLMVEPVQASRPARSEVRVPEAEALRGPKFEVGKRVNPRWREKVLAYRMGARTANRRRWARRES